MKLNRRELQLLDEAMCFYIEQMENINRDIDRDPDMIEILGNERFDIDEIRDKT